ncbi:hypothetical protein QEN19_001259 [Hanseniaspora menglaensis]
MNSLNKIFQHSGSILSFLIQWIQISAGESFNDHLLMLNLDCLISFYNKNIDSISNLMDENLGEQNDYTENYLIDRYYKYIHAHSSILDSSGNVITSNFNTNIDDLLTIKNDLISKLESHFKECGYDFFITNQINNKDYNTIYNSIANTHNFTDKVIHSKIQQWGNVSKIYSVIKQTQPGKFLGTKLAYQSSFSNHELFFIKTLVNTFSLSKNELLYKDYDGEISINIESIKENDDFYLIPIFKLLTNLEIIEELTFHKFLDSIRAKTIKIPFVEFYSYTLQEINQAYINQYSEFQKEELGTNNENNKDHIGSETIKEEINQIRESSIISLLEQLIQQNWVYKDPSNQYRPTLMVQLEFDAYFENSIICKFCKKKVIAHQGVVCKSCKKCALCLDCSYSFISKNKRGLNKKDKNVVDGKWCPECSEYWRTEDDLIFII